MSDNLTVSEARAALARALDARTIPAAQLATATALAGHFAHQWADAISIADIPAEGMSIAEIRQRAAAMDRAMPGIMAPFVDDASVIRHTTASGRLSWSILPDGAVQIEVFRPAGAGRISAHITATGEIQVWRVVGELHARHFAALREALCAIAGQAGETATLAAQADYFAAQVEEASSAIRQRVYGAPETAEDAVIEPLTVPDDSSESTL